MPGEAPQYEYNSYDSQVIVPRGMSARQARKWADDEALKVGRRSPYQPVPDGELALVANDLLWHAARLSTMPKAEVAHVWISEPRFGVDAFSWLTSLKRDESMMTAADAARYVISSDPLVGNPTTEVIELPAGPTARTFAIRTSAFNNDVKDVRHLEYYLFPPNTPDILIAFHIEWDSPEDDAAFREIADELMTSFTISSPKTVP